ncbi:MAG TPA: hypothetical protein VMU04_03890 [Candidatus Acidoferrum sp.]|nr:hypothetical protein [Candidatus Acidoferrum sp.]
MSGPAPSLGWELELATKPDFGLAMRRIHAWFQQEVLDRPPIRFSTHNAEYSALPQFRQRTWPDLKARWFDAEFQVDCFIESLRDRVFLAETFPVFWPNLGPEVYAAFYGSELIYQEVTSYAVPFVLDWDDVARLRLDSANAYFRKIEEMTRLALDRCPGSFLVGYTDLHPGADCAAAWRDPQNLCLDLICAPEQTKRLIALATADFHKVFDHFDSLLKAHLQPSVTWMGIPSFGKLHIPSCDFSAMISPQHFQEFCLPALHEEVKPMTHNIFHLDGPGVARHLDCILEMPEINAVQWVQGMGRNTPILQWLPLLKRIRSAGKSVVVDLQVSELEPFIGSLDPEGVLLCLSADPAIQPEIIKRVEKW